MKPILNMKHKRGIIETHINQTPTVVSPCTSVGSHLVPDMVSSGWLSPLCVAGVSEHPSSLAGRGRGWRPPCVTCAHSLSGMWTPTPVARRLPSPPPLGFCSHWMELVGLVMDILMDLIIT